MSDVNWMTKFVDNITNPDFKTVRQLLKNYLLEIDRGNCTMNPKEFTDIVESRQCGLNKRAEENMEAKS
eukprot:6902840-Ditylum_brightwellii.AAC.1